MIGAQLVNLPVGYFPASGQRFDMIFQRLHIAPRAPGGAPPYLRWSARGCALGGAPPDKVGGRHLDSRGGPWMIAGYQLPTARFCKAPGLDAGAVGLNAKALGKLAVGQAYGI